MLTISILVTLISAQWLQIDSSFTNLTFQNMNNWTSTTTSDLQIDTCLESPQQFVIFNSTMTKIQKLFPMRINEIKIIFDVYYSEVSNTTSTPSLLIEIQNKSQISTLYKNWSSIGTQGVTCNASQFKLQTIVTNQTKVDDSNANISISLITSGYETLMIRNLLIYAYFCNPVCQTCQSTNQNYCLICNDGSIAINGTCSCPVYAFSQLGFGCINECPRNNYSSDYTNRQCIQDYRMTLFISYFDQSSDNSTNSIVFISDPQIQNNSIVYQLCNEFTIGTFYGNQGFQYYFPNIQAYSFIRLRFTLYTFEWQPNSTFHIFFNNSQHRSVQLGQNSAFPMNFEAGYKSSTTCNPANFKLHYEANLYTNITNPLIQVYGNMTVNNAYWAINNITIDVRVCVLNCKICQSYTYCKECLPDFILYNNECVKQLPIYTSNGTDYMLQIPYSQYIAKGFYDLSMTQEQILSFFNSAPGTTSTGQNFSFFPNKIVVGGFMVWNNGNYSKNYTILFPHYAISVIFNITFGDNFTGDFQYYFDNKQKIIVTRASTPSDINIIGNQASETIVYQNYYYLHNASSFLIQLECLTQQSLDQGFCAISEYFIILHKVIILFIQCPYYCISCPNISVCNQCQRLVNNKFTNNHTNCFCNQFFHRSIQNQKCQCLAGYYDDFIDQNCWPICGDDQVVEGEDCDDGNNIPFDGCHQCKFSCVPECGFCNKGICEACKVGYTLIFGICLLDFDDSLFKSLVFIDNEFKCLDQQFIYYIDCISSTQELPNQFNSLCLDCLFCIQGVCAQCQANFYLLDGECITNSDFRSGLLQNQQNQEDFQVDSLCNENCLFCIKGICVKCQDYWDLWDNQCLPSCGNTFVQGNEQCDNGLFDQQYQGCLNCLCVQGYEIVSGSCKSICGDKYKTEDEECDDGNSIQNDGCDNCIMECKNCNICSMAICEQCNLGYYNYGQANCNSTECGDNIKAGLEQCDDGNNQAGDGCFNCLCERGWLQDSSGCQSVCGDGIKVRTEECDDGNIKQYDGCYDCILECKNCSICKVGICQQCKSGYYFDETSICSLTECGDNIKIESEQCDDGNQLTNDGCFDCKCEIGWRYDGYACQSICGDAMVVGKEECDDGNTIQFDGCFECQRYCYEKCILCKDKQCQACNDGFELINNKCVNTCGDGILNQETEQCDDSNQVARDGCFDCKIEKGFICYSDNLEFGYCEKCKEDHCASCSIIDQKQICNDCNTGYFIDKFFECQICDHICLECVKEPKNCIKFNYEIYQVKKCNETIGLYYDYQLRDCHSKCGDSIISGSEICDDGNVHHGCNDKCQIEQGYILDTENKQIIKEPNIFVDQKQSNNKQFLIVADANFQVINCSNTQVKIEQFEQSEFNYSISENQTEYCTITMEYYKTVETFNTIHILMNYKSIYQRRLLAEVIPQEVVITPQREVYATGTQTKQGAAVAQTSQTFTSTIMVLGPLAALMGGFKFIWAILDVLSWMNNFYYLNVSFPENVRQMFLLANWGNVINIPSFKVFNNEDDPYYFQSPQKFHEKDVDPLFFNNIQTVLIFFGYILFTTLISAGIRRMIRQYYHKRISSPKKILVLFKLNERSKQVNDTQVRKDSCQKEEQVQKQLPEQQEFQIPNKVKKIYIKCLESEKYFMANLLKIMQTNYLDITLAVMLQITNQQTSDYFIVKLNIIIAYASALILLFLLYFTFKISLTHQKQLDYEKFTIKYDCFYEGIQTESPSSMLYSFTNLLRKTIFIFSTVFFYDEPIFQTFFCFLSSLLNISLIILHNPFKSKEQLILNFIPDFGVFLVVGISILFAFQDKYQMFSDISIYVLGWFIVISVYISIGLQMLLLVKNLLVEIIGYIRQIWSSIREKLGFKT